MKRVPRPARRQLISGDNPDGQCPLETRKHALHLQFTPASVTSPAKDETQVPTNIFFWQAEKGLSSGRLPATKLARAKRAFRFIFNFPPINLNPPRSAGSSIIWRLDAKSVMSGANFHAAFEVPVFKVSGTEPVSPNDPDPTASLQMPVEAMRRDEGSIIHVSGGSRGRDFYFPGLRRNWKESLRVRFSP